MVGGITASNFWAIFGMSMLPIIELKGSIGWGLAQDVPFWTTYAIALIASCIPCPFIIFFIERVIKWMAGSKVRLFNKFANWLLGKVEKHQGKIEKYGYLGVFILCAIPLPGTGVWTSSLVAAMLELKPAKAIPVVVLGNVVAGLLMLVFWNLIFHDAAPWAG